MAFDKDEVRWFQISMHNAVFVDVINCLQHLFPHHAGKEGVHEQALRAGAGPVLCVGPAGHGSLSVLQNCGQINLTSLHDHVDKHLFPVHLRIYQLNDVFAALEAPEQIDLIGIAFEHGVRLVVSAHVHFFIGIYVALLVKNTIHAGAPAFP